MNDPTTAHTHQDRTMKWPWTEHLQQNYTRKSRTCVTVWTWFVITGLILFGFAFMLEFVVDKGIEQALEDAVVIHNPDRAGVTDNEEDSYDDWRRFRPEDEKDIGTIRVNMYLYNMTNPDEVLLEGAKPYYEEVGPFVYGLYSEKFDVDFYNDDEAVSFNSMTYFKFLHDETQAAQNTSAPGYSGELTEDVLITNVYPTYQEVRRIGRAYTRDEVNNFGLGFLHTGAWKEWMKSVREAARVDTCAGEVVDVYPDACWDLVYSLWGTGTSGISPEPTRAFYEPYIYYSASSPARSYNFTRSKWLLDGPYGFFHNDKNGERWQDVSWGTIFWYDYRIDPQLVMDRWQMTSDEATLMYDFLTSMNETIDTLMTDAFRKSTGTYYSHDRELYGLLARKPAKQWIFNDPDAFAEVSELTVNGAFLTNHTNKRGYLAGAIGEKQWTIDYTSAIDQGRDAIHTGFRSFKRVRNRLMYRDHTSLPSRNEIPLDDPERRRSYYCDAQVPVTGKDAGGTFIGKLSKDDRFTVWAEDVLRPVEFSYADESRVYSTKTWRYKPTPEKTYAPDVWDTSLYGQNRYAGMFNLSCVTSNVRVFTSLPRYHRASVPADMLVGGILPSNDDEHDSFYHMEPRSGYPFGGATRSMASVKGSINGTKEWMFPMFYVSIEGSISKDLVDDFEAIMDLPAQLRDAFIFFAIAVLLCGACGFAHVCCCRRGKRERDMAAEEKREAQERIDEHGFDEQARNFSPLFVYMFLHIVSYGIILPVLPTVVLDLYDQDFGKASVFVAVTSSVPAFLQFLSNPFMGTLSDLFGRKPFVLVAIAGMGVGFFLVGVNVSLVMLVISSVLRGLFDGAFTMGFTSLVDWSKPKDYSRRFGQVGAALGLGLIIGPLIGAVLGAVDNPNLPFLFSAGVEVINFLYTFFVVPETCRAANELSYEERKANFSWAPANPLFNLRIFRASRYLLWLGGSVFMNILSATIVSVWFLYTAYRYDWEPTDNGLFLFTFGLLVIIQQGGVLKYLHQALGDKRALDVTYVTYAIGFVFFGIASKPWMMYLFIVVFSVGFIANPLIRDLIAREIPDIEQGRLQGALSGIAQIANGIGPLMMGALFAYFVSDDAPTELPGAPFFLAALMNVAGYAIIVFLAKEYPDKFVDDIKSYERAPPPDIELEGLGAKALGVQHADELEDLGTGAPPSASGAHKRLSATGKSSSKVQPDDVHLLDDPAMSGSGADENGDGEGETA